jgi:hypothetical protein
LPQIYDDRYCCSREESGELNYKSKYEACPEREVRISTDRCHHQRAGGLAGREIVTAARCDQESRSGRGRRSEVKKPSRPSGVPVWPHDGIICIADTLKNAVRLTFPKGAQMKDPKKLFNTRLDSKTVRAIDFHEGEAVDEVALKALILEAVRLNVPKTRER